MTNTSDYLLRLEKDIAASLYMAPATLDELCERDFLEYIADFNVDRILMKLENKGWIFVNREGKYQTYKKVASRELSEHELV